MVDGTIFLKSKGSPMEKEIKNLQEVVEVMPTDKLHCHLIAMINQARIDSINSNENNVDVLRLSGTKENMYFDRLVYFYELTKKLPLSICDCDKELESIRAQWQDLCLRLKEKLEELDSTASALVTNVSGMLEAITDGRILSHLEQEPLTVFLNALKKNEPVDWPDFEEALKKADYKPYGFDRMYSKLYIRAGEYEKYCNCRDEALRILILFKSEEFESKISDYNESCELKKALEKKSSDMRIMKVEWRNSLKKCFNVNYESDQLRIESLMVI